MSSILENYCDVTESLAFKSSEINSSSSIESGNSNKQKPNKLKCFNCFDINNKTEYCTHCNSTGYVTDSHPLALLFSDILYQKLDATPINQIAWTDFDEVEIIREQEEDLDERKIICDVCNIECDINYKYYCQCCECFYVCVKCADEKGDEIDHQHPLATNKQLPIPDLKFKRTDSSNFESNKFQDHQKQNQFFFNINDIISQDFRIYFQKLVKNHMTDSNQFSDCDMADSIILKKPFSFEAESITQSKGPKGLFSQKVPYKKQHFWEVSPDGELVKVEPEQIFQSIFFDKIQPSHSRVMGGSQISVRDSIDFNLFDNDPLGVSVGPRQSFGFGSESLVLEFCHSCSTELKNFYSICKTCEKSKINFKVCCQCYDAQNHNHDKSHEIEMVLGNLLGRRSQMVSESAIDSQQQDQDFFSMRMTKKKSSLQKRLPRLPQLPSFDEDQSGKKSFCKIKFSESLNMNTFGEVQIIDANVNNFGDESLINLDFEGLYNSTQFVTNEQMNKVNVLQKKQSLLDVNNSIENLPNLSRFNQKKQEKPRVCFVQTLQKDQQQIPFQYVESDSQSSSEEASPKFIDVRKSFSKGINRTSHKLIKSLKQIQFSQTENKMLTSSSREITSSINYNRSSIKFTQRQYQSTICQREQKQTINQINQVEEFIFHQYSCDECGCHPIKNVMFHCLECEDYDVCEQCFDSDIEVKHEHGFERIDGLKKMQDQRALLLQRKDLNKGRQSLVRNSNVSVGMLAKTKRTVEMMKKGVNQLNNSVMNVTKSYGNYGQILGQRMSLRQRAQG